MGLRFAAADRAARARRAAIKPRTRLAARLGRIPVKTDQTGKAARSICAMGRCRCNACVTNGASSAWGNAVCIARNAVGATRARRVPAGRAIVALCAGLVGLVRASCARCAARLALQFLVSTLCAAGAHSLARRSRDAARGAWRASYRTGNRSVVACLARLASEALRPIAELSLCARIALLGTRSRVRSCETFRAIHVPQGRRESPRSAGNAMFGAQHYSDGVVALRTRIAVI